MPRGKFSVTGETTLLAKIAGDFKDYEWIYRFGANPGMPRGGVLPPTPVWALSFTHISLLTEVLTVINLAAIFNNTIHLFELSNELNENTITI